MIHAARKIIATSTTASQANKRTRTEEWTPCVLESGHDTNCAVRAEEERVRYVERNFATLFRRFFVPHNSRDGRTATTHYLLPSVLDHVRNKIRSLTTENSVGSGRREESSRKHQASRTFIQSIVHGITKSK